METITQSRLLFSAEKLENVKPDNKVDVKDIKNVLIVEDDPDIGDALKIGLEQFGFDVELYNEPLKMLSSYRSGKYNLLVFDIHMPNLNGFELYKLVKKLDEHAVICFLTAFEEYYDEFKRQFPSLDMKYFIRKPIPMKDLIDKVTSIAKENKG